MSNRYDGQQGQTTTETILMLPLFLLFAFGLLQIAQLGVALVVVTYGATSVGRTVMQDNSVDTTNVTQGFGPVAIQPDIGQNPRYFNQFQNLLTAGMSITDGGLHGCVEKDSPSTATLTVYASASVRAFPLIGQFLWPVLKTQYDGGLAQGGTRNPDYACQHPDDKSMGPFYFQRTATGIYQFIVRGRSAVELNYQGKPA